MLWFLSLFLGNDTLVRDVVLQNDGIFLGNIGPTQIHADGSVIIGTKYHVWHWDKDGQLLLKFGGRGQGPGEFNGVGAIHFDGAHYWVIDGMEMDSQIFDANGQWLFRQGQIYFRQFIPVGDRLFALDILRAYHAEGFGRLIQEVRYQVEGKKLKVFLDGLQFKLPSERMHDYKYNFKFHWLVEEEDGFLVMEALEDKIYRYSPRTIKSEEGLHPGTFVQAPSFFAQLPHYVPPPKFDRSKPFTSMEDIRKWANSWSLINFFGRLGTGFIVGYRVPMEKDDFRQAIQVLEADGKAIRPTLFTEGEILGLYKDSLYLFVQDEATDQIDGMYHLEIHRF